MITFEGWRQDFVYSRMCKLLEKCTAAGLYNLRTSLSPRCAVEIEQALDAVWDLVGEVGGTLKWNLDDAAAGRFVLAGPRGGWRLM